MNPGLILLIIFLSIPQLTLGMDSYLQLKSKQGLTHWLRLLHMEGNEDTGYQSRVDNPDFFFHEKGSRSPWLELDASIEAFKTGVPKSGPLDQHPQCAFPERFRFLSELGFIDTKKIECLEYLNWKKGIDASSMALIFSSSFPNNPASTFGHTFFRFNQQGKSNDLLDYTANFSADTKGVDEGFLYAYNGVFGGFYGRFSFAPYYQKVDEYANAESRDIYEYELNIGSLEMERIVGHIWELYYLAFLQYWFFTENCSYVLGTVLEVGNDKWTFTKKNKLYYLPADLVKQVVATEGLIKQVKFRPSIRRKLEYHYSKLDADEKFFFKQIVSGDLDIGTIDNYKVLNTLIHFYDFKKYRKKGNVSLEEKNTYHKVLLKRSQLPVEKSEVINWQQYNRPDQGLEPQRLIVWGEYRQREWFGVFGYKLGYHDLLSRDEGYEPYSKFNLVDLEISYREKLHKWDFSQIGVVDILSLHPLTSYDPRFSWQVVMANNSLIDHSSLDARKWQAYGGLGVAYDLSGRVYSMLGGEIQLSEYISKSVHLGPYLEWGYITNLFFKSKMSFKQKVFFDGLDKDKNDFLIENEIGYGYAISRTQELRFIGMIFGNSGDFTFDTYQIKVGYAYYF